MRKLGTRRNCRYNFFPVESGAKLSIPPMSCPACGVAVTPGYVKCPKCHAALPKMRSKRASVAGGTSVESESSPPWTLIGLGVALAAGVAVAVIALRGGGGPSQAPPSEDAAPGTMVVDDVPASADQPTPVAAPTGPDRAVVLRDLDAALRKGRLWATIVANDTDVTITSASCEDAALAGHVDAAAADLAAIGIRSVECRARHGEVVFSREY